MQLTQLYAQLETRRLQMQEDVFAHAPVTFEEFKFRQGQWVELDLQLRELRDIIKGIES